MIFLAARAIPSRYTAFASLRVGRGPHGAFVVVLAGAPDTPTQLVRIDLATGEFAVLAESEAELPDESDLSLAQPLLKGETLAGLKQRLPHGVTPVSLDSAEAVLLALQDPSLSGTTLLVEDSGAADD